MSALIGNVNGPHHNSPHAAAEVWCSPSQVELTLLIGESSVAGAAVNLDPIAARNLAALLVRASEEAERMAARREAEQAADRTPVEGESR